jgi:hypothetical protein
MIVVITANLPGHCVCDVKGHCFGVIGHSR